ncbi:MAG: hypothetical protein ACREAG_04215 [Nitrosopumilaceae archaeon]
MKKSVILSIILGLAIISGLVFLQISSACYPKKIEIEFDLKDFEAGSLEYTQCLDLQDRIKIFNQKCDPDFDRILC